MARNAEKAMTALARFRQAQLEEGKVKEQRPFLASECNELPKAEKWRRQIIGEISKKVAQIQNAGLGEFRIRDLNNEINKLLREKGHWEYRIKELGGPDYARIGPKMLLPSLADTCLVHQDRFWHPMVGPEGTERKRVKKE
uniref:Pre-mRNA-splicing factor ISY1 homolog n=1 Tax=Geospiza parvula TaxID=87175 RepID=A0A8U8AT02_GEOPR